MISLVTNSTLDPAAWPAWVVMWALAFAIYGSLKGLTFAGAVRQSGNAGRNQGWPRAAGYLLLWPGMDADAFLGTNSRTDKTIASRLAWASAGARITLGFALIYAAAPLARGHSELVAGWLGMTGLLMILHCGVFDVLSLAWRRAGVDAPPLMNHPLWSTSLADFWGHRWNRAFRDVAHRYLFRPLLRPLGAAGATLAAFLFSGVVHDIVISLPAGGGYGLPTLYFVLQGLGLLIERSKAGQRLGLRRGLRGRLFCAAVTIGPLGLLFHPPFVRGIIVPMLRAIGAL